MKHGSTTRDWSARGHGGTNGGFGGTTWHLCYTNKGCSVGFPTILLGNNGKTNMDV